MVPKFRAYDTKNKVMVSNFQRSQMKIETGRVLYQLTTTNENEIKAVASYNTFDDFTYRYSHDLELMQSTGLKDKNGVEIFEGDVLKNTRNGKIRRVHWNPSCASFHLSKHGIEESKVEYWSLSNPQWSYEIIGNIYENPELLEQADES